MPATLIMGDNNMGVESESKVYKDMTDRCSTGEPFIVDELKPEDMYNFTLAACIYGGYTGRRRIKLRPYQLRPAWRVVESVTQRLGLEIVAMFSRQSGKTTGLPGAGLHFISALPTIYKPMKDGFQAGIFGPKRNQATHAFNMYKFFHDTHFLHDHLGISTLKNNSEELWLSNGTRIYCETASINAMIERLTLDLAYCEESQNITDTRLLNSIYPMCASTNGTRVLTGNPTPERLGHFYNISSRAGPNIFVTNWEEVIKESMDKYARDYEMYVTKEMNKHGRQSDYFKTQYDLEWTSISSNFVTIEELTELQGGKILLQTDEPVVVGIDPARVNDSTVMTIMSMIGKPHICLWAEWRGDDWKTQSQDIESILSNFPNIFIVNIDTLHGEGISDYLPEHIPIARLPMERNIQSFMWQELRKAIVNKAFSYPAVDQVERYRFEDQMTSMTAKWVGNLLKVAAPNQRNKHDDYGDSLALVWFALCTRPQDSLEPTELKPIVPRKIKRPRASKPKGFTRPKGRPKR